MRFARLGEPGREVPVLVEGDAYYDISPITEDIAGDFFRDETRARIAAAAHAGELTRVDADGARIGAPIARPSAIICVGMNYAAHAAESGAEPPKNVVIFHKTPNTIAGPNDDVAIPRGSRKTDWEVELGVVIKSRASYIDGPADALSHVAGYVLANDLSEREWQLEISGGQWGKGKSAPGFSPIGPWLVTPDEVDISDLRLRSWVNGEPRQDSTTADMIFDVPYIVWHLSQFMVLEPGDLILTGTPAGVALSGRFPYVKSRDVVELAIDGLGTQRQVFL
jgi:2-keto-4-pentenoate hydratase/2-oxohepta-3-ene-1,7-dioic acid hydratase in catechol pathway